MAASIVRSSEHAVKRSKKGNSFKNSSKFQNGKNKTSDLFGNEDEECEELSLRVNSDYAKNYQRWRSLEERQKLISRYGNTAEEIEESSSSSEEEDETGDRLPADFDKNFYRTLACLRKKDSRIYDKGHRFFSSETIGLSQNKSEHSKGKSESKPMFLHDYERELLLSHNGNLVDDEEEDKARKIKLFERNQKSSYVEEQNKLKKSFQAVLEDSDDDDECLLKVKSKEEISDQGEASQNGRSKDEELEKEIEKVWANKLDEGEAFLRDFFLERRYLDRDSEGRIPTYDEIVAPSEDESEQESFNEHQELFEHKYNFRFEEPDQDFIKRYPRTMTQTFRRTDDKRKLKRQEIKERKLQEKEQKRNELKRLKALKRAEIQEKLDKIKKITGNTKVGFGDIDLDEDFDSEAHDKRMGEIFDNEYYEDEEEEHPELQVEEDDLVVDNWDEWQGDDATEMEPHCEDPDFIMDCDYDPTARQKQDDLTGKTGKKKKKGRNFRSALRSEKPSFDPSEKTFEDYFDEYYKLDYEDMIGDLPCRFKYRKVVPNDFGLSLEEVLTADDKELNQWCSLKKACQYRPEEEERYDVQAYEKQARNYKKKMKILKSVYQKDDEDEESASNEASTTHLTEMSNEHKKEGLTPKMGKKRKSLQASNERNSKWKSKQARTSEDTETGITDSRLKAYGINPKKFKNKLKYGKKNMQKN